MVPDVLPEAFRLNASPALKVMELPATLEIVSKAVAPELLCSIMRSPARRAVLPTPMMMQVQSKVTVVVLPAVTMLPAGNALGLLTAHPGVPAPGVRMIGNSFSQ